MKTIETEIIFYLASMDFITNKVIMKSGIEHKTHLEASTEHSKLSSKDQIIYNVIIKETKLIEPALVKQGKPEKIK